MATGTSGSNAQPSTQASGGKRMVKNLLARLYGLRLLRNKDLYSYVDQIYHVTVSMDTANDYIQIISENGYLLKIVHTEDSQTPDIYAAHDELLSHVERQGIPVTRLVPTTDGRRVTVQKLVRSGTTALEGEFVVLLFDYCPGLPMSEVDCWRDLLSEYGAMLGRLHTALQGYRDPRLDSHGSWNRLTETPDQRVKDALRCCYHDDQRAMVRNLEVNYKETLAPMLPALRKGVIHGDYRTDNVITTRHGSDCAAGSTGDSGYTIAAIIDFNDASTGHYVYDIGIAVADVIITCDEDEERLKLARRIVQGYLQEFSLSDVELGALHLCVCLRTLGHVPSPGNGVDNKKYARKIWNVLKFLIDLGNTRFKDTVCNHDDLTTCTRRLLRSHRPARDKCL